MAALLVGLVGRVVLALSPATAIYLLGQVLIGVGLGAVYGAAFAYIRAVAAPGKLAGAVGVFGATIGLATLILTFVGGSMVAVNWWLSYLVVPVLSLVAVFLVPMILPAEERVRGSKQNFIGQVLLALGIIAFLRRQRARAQPDQPEDAEPAGSRRDPDRRVLRLGSENPDRFFPVAFSGHRSSSLRSWQAWSTTSARPELSYACRDPRPETASSARG
jgi:MFS family permease